MKFLDISDLSQGIELNLESGHKQKKESTIAILPAPLAAALLPRTSEAARAVDVEVFRKIRTQRIK
jgi:hypothetical protein